MRGFREDGGEMDGPEEGGGDSPRWWKQRAAAQRRSAALCRVMIALASASKH